MNEIRYEPIGTIHSPFQDLKGTPIQPTAAYGVAGTVEIKPPYADGLKDLDGFSHIILLYHFHCSNGPLLQVKPFLDDSVRGIFSTRAPRRPNPIGLSVVRLTGVETTTLYIDDVDIVDGTPLLDIKPYVPQFDHRQVDRIGWLSEKVNDVYVMKSDDRFR
ncbi:MAG TPA: tRNA (N6-threonylcarbamoyladenosine(37)-N6)-methyltransferase TrmO [Deltaproteobacteria bacterium]|nr:tRNA (N6-threonylcarbamoyladenosine(37)-N6)-methyltransferase TrmO [Deltaproteobacteria bacterium]